MNNPDFRKILKKNQNRYEFAKAVAKRANYINENKYLKEKRGDENSVSFALEEFVEGKLEMSEESEN